jgi:hypothetical protein
MCYGNPNRQCFRRLMSERTRTAALPHSGAESLPFREGI